MPTAVKPAQQIVGHGKEIKARPITLALSGEDARHYVIGHIWDRLKNLEQKPRGSQSWRLCYWAALFFERMHYTQDGNLRKRPLESIMADPVEWGLDLCYGAQTARNEFKNLADLDLLERVKVQHGAYRNFLGPKFPRIMVDRKFISIGQTVEDTTIAECLAKQARRKNATGKQTDTTKITVRSTTEPVKIVSFDKLSEDTNAFLSQSMQDMLEAGRADLVPAFASWMQLAIKIRKLQGVENVSEQLMSLIEQANELLIDAPFGDPDIMGELHHIIAKLYKKSSLLQLAVSFKEKSNDN